jgi:hypothetical protein
LPNLRGGNEKFVVSFEGPQGITWPTGREQCFSKGKTSLNSQGQEEEAVAYSKG